MKIRIFGFALLLGLATTLGACEGAEETPTTDVAPPPAVDATPEPTATP